MKRLPTNTHGPIVAKRFSSTAVIGVVTRL